MAVAAEKQQRHATDIFTHHKPTTNIETSNNRRYPTHTCGLNTSGSSLSVVHSPGPWLVDTGLPVSYGQCSFQFNNVPGGQPCRVSLPSEVGDHKAVELNGHSRISCYGALGADILCESRTLFDLSEGIIEIGSEKQLEGISFELSFTKEGCPVAWLDLVSQDYRPFLISTGTRHTYLKDEIFQYGRERVKLVRDYAWELGSFETRVCARVADHQPDRRPSLRPLYNAKVSKLCSRLRVDGVLGWEFFDGHAVQIDRISGEIIVSRGKGKGLANWS